MASDSEDGYRSRKCGPEGDRFDSIAPDGDGVPVFALDDETIRGLSTVAGRDHVGFEPEEVLVAGRFVPPLLKSLGDELYTHDAEAAQEALRHQSIETTHKSHRDRDGERVRERAQEILNGE